MRRIVLALVAAAALAVPAAASAGGFATVALSTLPGDDLRGGDRWSPELTVLQHGRTPLDGLQPRLTIRNPTTGATQTFDARPTGEPGRYVVDVRFPSAGTWAYEIDDGFTSVHTYAPVTVGEPLAGGRTWTPFLVVAALALALAAAAAALVRRRPAPAPSASAG
jgi:hypothetical protein